MPSRHRQKIGAFLGMFAILLSIVAPTMSQVLRGAHGEVEHHALHEHQGFHAHHELHARHWHHLQQAGEITSAAHAGHAGHHQGSDSSPLCDACPYCGLIAHSPALPSTVAISGVAPRNTSFRPPAVAAVFRPYTVLTPAQPRAPPALS